MGWGGNSKDSWGAWGGDGGEGSNEGNNGSTGSCRAGDSGTGSRWTGDSGRGSTWNWDGDSGEGNGWGRVAGWAGDSSRGNSWAGTPSWDEDRQPRWASSTHTSVPGQQTWRRSTAGRRLACSRCSAHFRGSYRGASRPLCQGCRAGPGVDEPPAQAAAATTEPPAESQRLEDAQRQMMQVQAELDALRQQSQAELDALRQQLCSTAATLVPQAMPSYFTGTSTPSLVEYRPGGFNHANAEKMLNHCVAAFCKTSGCCQEHQVAQFPYLAVKTMHRLENESLFSVFQAKEAAVAKEMSGKPELIRVNNAAMVPALCEWLTRLEKKNGLSAMANTRYMLHGTAANNLDSILQNGLSSKFSMDRNPIYGKGTYFTDSSCKACQYTDEIILVCRVVLGQVFALETVDQQRAFSPASCHSCMAQAGKTAYMCGAEHRTQLHNELIVYQDAQVYPEFVIRLRDALWK